MEEATNTTRRDRTTSTTTNAEPYEDDATIATTFTSTWNVFGNSTVYFEQDHKTGSILPSLGTSTNVDEDTPVITESFPNKSNKTKEEDDSFMMNNKGTSSTRSDANNGGITIVPSLNSSAYVEDDCSLSFHPSKADTLIAREALEHFAEKKKKNDDDECGCIESTTTTTAESLMMSEEDETALYQEFKERMIDERKDILPPPNTTTTQYSSFRKKEVVAMLKKCFQNFITVLLITIAVGGGGDGSIISTTNISKENHQSSSSSKLYNTNLILAGNPGVGKSTILNGLLQEARFQSGISFNGGLTSNLQYETDTNGNTFGDTPGLSTLNNRKKAAREITKALKKSSQQEQEGGELKNERSRRFKLVFVITQEAGRVRPVDNATMKLILDAFPNNNVPYGIIVNKIERSLLAKLTKKNEDEKKNEEEREGGMNSTSSTNLDKFTSLLNDGRKNKTAYIYFNERDEKLASEDNAIPEIKPELIQFLNLIPPIHIVNPNEVRDVNMNLYDSVRNKMEQRLNKLEHDKKLLEMGIIRDRVKLRKQMKKISKDSGRKDNHMSVSNLMGLLAGGLAGAGGVGYLYFM